MKGNPMRSDAERIAKYIAKVVPSTVGLKIAAQLETMKTGFGSAIEDLVEKEIAVQVILNEEMVPGIDYPFYYSFAREIFKRVRAGINGPSLLTAVDALITKYDAYGLGAPILIRIAAEVFTITRGAPEAPLLLLPEDEAILVPLTGDLTWSAAARASGYDVWLFLDGETPAKVATNQPGLSYAYTVLPDYRYRWYIIAVNAYGTAKSEERTFDSAPE